MTIYIIIPVHNEAHNIVAVAHDVCSVLKKDGFTFKLIIIDDGSTDETGDLLNSLPFRDSVELLQNKKRCGLGPVLSRGLRYSISLSTAEDDIVITMEGDGTSDALLIPEIISNIIKGKDVIIASRFLKKSSLTGFPLSRKIFSYTVNYIFALLCKVPCVKDYTILYRGYRINVIKRASLDYGKRLILMKDFESNTELLLKLARYNMNISEIPLVYNYSLKKSKSKMNIILTVFRYLRLLYSQIIKKPFRDDK
jgi:glycosyltransferase involved in cell wall biosynthesis